MKSYKVLAHSVTGIKNRTYAAGTEVSEDQFLPGHADAFVGHGFLERLDDGSGKLEVQKPEVGSRKSEEKKEEEKKPEFVNPKPEVKKSEIKIETVNKKTEEEKKPKGKRRF